MVLISTEKDTYGVVSGSRLFWQGMAEENSLRYHTSCKDKIKAELPPQTGRTRIHRNTIRRMTTALRNVPSNPEAVV